MRVSQSEYQAMVARVERARAAKDNRFYREPTAQDLNNLDSGLKAVAEKAWAAHPNNKKRVRQSSKPLLNELELRFRLVRLPELYLASTRITEQAMRVKIAGSAWYKVDFFIPSLMHAHEVKGPRCCKNQQSRQILALKVAANQWPEITWFLNWFEDGEWQQQKILP